MSEETIAKRVINRRRGIIPQKFIFILDRSGSMTGQRFYALTNYLRTHIESNGIESISSIFLFNDRTRLFYPTETVNQNNLIQELGGSFIIISELPVSQMDIKLRDLASRVSTMSTVELKLPDDEIIKGVMGKLFKDRQINVSNDVVNYLCRRMERSFKEVARLVDRLDKISLSEKNAISLSLARRILQETC